MSAIGHIGLGDWRALVVDLDAMGLIKPTTDRTNLAGDLEKEFYKVLGQVPS